MLSVDVTPPTEVGEQLLDVPLGEGARSPPTARRRRTAARRSRSSAARATWAGCSRGGAQPPDLLPRSTVGSKRSEGMVFQDVWEQKEAALMANYGSQLWSAMTFLPELAGVRVSSLDELLAGPCMLAISPRPTSATSRT